jgi:hypothetical protein
VVCFCTPQTIFTAHAQIRLDIIFKELIYAYLNSFGQNNRLRYGNNSYSLFTLSEYWWEWWHMSLIYYIGVLLLKRNSSVQDLQAYTYARTVFIQDLGFFNWTVNVWIIMVWMYKQLNSWNSIWILLQLVW